MKKVFIPLSVFAMMLAMVASAAAQTASVKVGFHCGTFGGNGKTNAVYTSTGNLYNGKDLVGLVQLTAQTWALQGEFECVTCKRTDWVLFSNNGKLNGNNFQLNHSATPTYRDVLNPECCGELDCACCGECVECGDCDCDICDVCESCPECSKCGCDEIATRDAYQNDSITVTFVCPEDLVTVFWAFPNVAFGTAFDWDEELMVYQTHFGYDFTFKIDHIEHMWQVVVDGERVDEFYTYNGSWALADGYLGVDFFNRTFTESVTLTIVLRCMNCWKGEPWCECDDACECGCCIECGFCEVCEECGLAGDPQGLPTNKGCENCQGNNAGFLCDGSGCAGNGKGAPGGDQGGGGGKGGNQNEQ